MATGFVSIECKNINMILEEDTHRIDEGLRRLIEGTCCLQGEDQMAAYELFSKVRWAIEDHIRIEDAECAQVVSDCGAAGFSVLVAKAMLEEHRHIESLIMVAQRELEEAHGDGFRSALSNLVASFDEHHMKAMAQLESSAASVASPETFARLYARSGACCIE